MADSERSRVSRSLCSPWSGPTFISSHTINRPHYLIRFLFSQAVIDVHLNPNSAFRSFTKPIFLLRLVMRFRQLGDAELPLSAIKLKFMPTRGSGPSSNSRTAFLYRIHISEYERMQVNLNLSESWHLRAFGIFVSWNYSQEHSSHSL